MSAKPTLRHRKDKSRCILVFATLPDVKEQPFTRSQSGIVIPPGVTRVRVRAHDLVDGFGGREVLVDLTVSSGPDFKVEHTG
ncbi:MAG: hypothetical protein J7M30_16620 [Deltaproteobacteria bacterium]|nr:hypothetical protein [Deltaproteobacteria bacterium]